MTDGRVRPGTPAAVITASNRSARGEREDSSGQLLAARLRELGCEVTGVTVVPDDVLAIQGALRKAVAGGAQVVVTTGGTMTSERLSQPFMPTTVRCWKEVSPPVGITRPRPSAARRTTRSG